MKIVVYSCTFPDYDLIFSPIERTPGVDYVLFSPRRPRLSRGWRWRSIPPEVVDAPQNIVNRFCKFFPHRLFPDADISIYVDGNILIRGDLSPLIREFAASDADIGLFRHAERRSVAEEVAFAKASGRVAPPYHDLADRQLADYAADGLPTDHVLTQNAVIFRRHRDHRLPDAMAMLWEHLQRYTQRDQISMPYIIFKNNLKLYIWNWDYKQSNIYFMRYSHRKSAYNDILLYIGLSSFYNNFIGKVFRSVNHVIVRSRLRLRRMGLISASPRR